MSPIFIRNSQGGHEVDVGVCSLQRKVNRKDALAGGRHDGPNAHLAACGSIGSIGVMILRPMRMASW